VRALREGRTVDADLIVPEGGHNQVAMEMLLTLIRSLTR
jgi:hypothetical protein